MNGNIYRKKISRARGRAAIILLVPALVIMTAAALLTMAAGSAYADSEDGKRELEIEIVEEVPAVDIEEQAVPLAALPSSPASENKRHAIMMSAAILCAAGYLIYFRRYEKKLARLRKLAAAAEAGFSGTGKGGGTW